MSETAGSEQERGEPGKKYAALVSYAGTHYRGWQKQKGSAAEGGPSVQETFEEALRKVTSETEARIVGSGRTDGGVHATGQVVHFMLKRREWDCGILRKGLNSALPIDIRAVAVRPVPIEFHAQRSAEKKQYSYYFQQGPAFLPHLYPYSWWIMKPLDLEAMHRSASFLIGRHDYKPFQAAGAKPGSTVREIMEAVLTRESLSFPSAPFLGPQSLFEPTATHDRVPFSLIRFRIVGTGFLKQMVRGIAGTLLQVGEGRRPPEDMKRILETGDRSLVGQTTPGRGLWLERVWYPGIEF